MYGDMSICDYLNDKKKISAIKEIRNILRDVFGPAVLPGDSGHGIGLKQCVDYVDGIQQWERISNGILIAQIADKYMNYGFRAYKGLPMDLDGMAKYLRDLEVPNPPVQEFHGQLVGWRIFRYEDQNLRSLFRHQVPFQALGKTIDTAEEPTITNTTGFWAFKNKKDAVEYYGRPEIPDTSVESIIFATVLLSGDVIEHEIGYRASEIELLGLYGRMNNSRRRGIGHKLGWPGTIQPLSKGPENFTNNITEA